MKRPGVLRTATFFLAITSGFAPPAASPADAPAHRPTRSQAVAAMPWAETMPQVSGSVQAPRSAGIVGRVADPPATRVTVSPDTVTVGDRFRVMISAAIPTDVRIEASLLPDPANRWQSLGAAVRTDSAGQARLAFQAVAWVPGPSAPARATVRIVAANGVARTIPVSVRMPLVRATLPADSTRPRGPKDILATVSRPLPWVWIGAAVAALVILLAGWRFLRRHPRYKRGDPRRIAVARLDQVRQAGLLERGDVTGFYAETSAAVRAFAAAVDAQLGPDLTSEELLASVAGGNEALARVLAGSDRVKFARHTPTAEQAVADWEAARGWITRFRTEAEGDGSKEGVA